MTQLEDAPGEPTTTIYSRGDNSSQSRGDGDLPLPPVNDSPSVTGTIAAVTVAVLACVLLLTMIVICRALRKRRRARQGERIDDIPTVSTGIMGTGVAAYSNIQVDGNITWESVNNSNHPATAAAASSSSHRNGHHTSRRNQQGRPSRLSHSSNS